MVSYHLKWITTSWAHSLTTLSDPSVYMFVLREFSCVLFDFGLKKQTFQILTMCNGGHNIISKGLVNSPFKVELLKFISILKEYNNITSYGSGPYSRPVMDPDPNLDLLWNQTLISTCYVSGPYSRPDMYPDPNLDLI